MLLCNTTNLPVQQQPISKKRLCNKKKFQIFVILPKFYNNITQNYYFIYLLFIALFLFYIVIYNFWRCPLCMSKASEPVQKKIKVAQDMYEKSEGKGKGKIIFLIILFTVLKPSSVGLQFSPRIQRRLHHFMRPLGGRLNSVSILTFGFRWRIHMENLILGFTA